MIHQHFKLVDVFSAAENIVLGLDGERKLDLKAASAKILEISEKYGFSIDPNKKIYDMSVSEKQTVEIIKVLYRGADILILDEPTAVLTPQETDRLFDVMRNMKADGKAKFPIQMSPLMGIPSLPLLNGVCQNCRLRARKCSRAVSIPNRMDG